MLRANIIRHGRVLEAAIEFLWVVVFVCKVTFVLSPTAVEAELGSFPGPNVFLDSKF